MKVQGHAPNLISIQASAEQIREFREALGFYLQTVRQSVNRFEYHVGKIAKNPDVSFVETVMGGNEAIASMRADMSNFETKWNRFNDALEPQPVT